MNRRPAALMHVATQADADALLPMFAAYHGEHLHARPPAAVRERMRAAPMDSVLLAPVDGRPPGFPSLRILLTADVENAEARAFSRSIGYVGLGTTSHRDLGGEG